MEEISVTWRLAWGLWWRMMLITLGIYAIIGAIGVIIAFIIGATALLPLLPSW